MAYLSRYKKSDLKQLSRDEYAKILGKLSKQAEAAFYGLYTNDTKTFTPVQCKAKGIAD